ncbi:MAG: formyltetrahydrofolate deformylase [Alicyclobacillus sp.]|nr:formyltetrahydrofolate deformylase [Alicyclobacillus sp.]
MRNRARLLISCPDRPGIVAAIAQFLYQQGANITQFDQYSAPPDVGLFFTRVEFDLPQLPERLSDVRAGFAGVADQFSMDWHMELASVAKRAAIFVSKEDHCLLELLWQWQTGDLFMDIAMVISNHPDARETVEALGLPFYYIPVERGHKAPAEAAQLQLLAGKVDFLVLARYMQILSPDFVAQYPNRIINIHHSFLPAFIGRNPYGQAYERGVKLIGATAHYVTEDLDEGPIIEQDVHRVDHRATPADLKRIGRHVERVVLARAVKWHLEDRILIHGNKTIVFS